MDSSLDEITVRATTAPEIKKHNWCALLRAPAEAQPAQLMIELWQCASHPGLTPNLAREHN
jgi:hypothetical protein